MTQRHRTILRGVRSGLLLSLVGIFSLGFIPMALSGADAAEQPRPGRRRPGRLRNAVVFGLHQLDLTEEQRQAIRTVRESRRTSRRDIKERSAPIRKALRDAATAPIIDEAMIRHLTSQLADIQAESAIASATIRAEVLQLLAPEQQDALQELQAARERRIEERRSRVRNR